MVARKLGVWWIEWLASVRKVQMAKDYLNSRISFIFAAPKTILLSAPYKAARLNLHRSVLVAIVGGC